MHAGSHAKACMYVLLGSKGGKTREKNDASWAMRARVTTPDGEGVRDGQSSQ